MTSIGLIHMLCECEAELFYLGNTPDGTLPSTYIDRFLSQLSPGKYGVFSSADGNIGECPHCGLLIELPDPDLVDWLPFADSVTVNTMIDLLLAAEGQEHQRELHLMRAQRDHA